MTKDIIEINNLSEAANNLYKMMRIIKKRN